MRDLHLSFSRPSTALHLTSRAVVLCDAAGETRSFDRGGYEAPIDKVTWAPFTYSPPRQRREFVEAYTRKRRDSMPTLPPLHVVLLGGPSSGKGTIAPMLSQCFRVRVVGVGQLLRGELRAARPRAAAAAAAMARGELLSDALTCELLLERNILRSLAL